MNEYGAKLSVQNLVGPQLKSITDSMNELIVTTRKFGEINVDAIDNKALGAYANGLNSISAKFYNISEELITASKNQEDYNKKIKDAIPPSSSLLNIIKGIAASYLGIKGFSLFKNFSDDMNNIRSRLKIVLDGSSKDVDTFFNEIKQSAERSRGDFKATTDIIGKLGMQAKNAFTGTDELVMFSELLNKNLVVAGASGAGAESVIYNLTQAMGAGVIRGQDFNAIMQNAPLILQNVAKYMGKPVEEVRKLAEEGKITSKIFKESMFWAAEETNKKFESMPITFSQHIISIKNSIADAFLPLTKEFSNLINSNEFKSFVNWIKIGINTIGIVIKNIIDLLTELINYFVKAGYAIKPIIPIIISVGLAWKTCSLLAGFSFKTMAANFIAMSKALILTSVSTVKNVAANFTSLGSIFEMLKNIVSTINIPMILITIGFMTLFTVLKQLGVKASDVFAFIGGAVGFVGALIYNIVMGIGTFIINIGISVINFGRMMLNKIMKAVVSTSDGSLTAFGKFVDKGIILFNGLLNFIIHGLNGIIRMINKLNFDIPEWLGGGHFGITINEIGDVKLPKVEDVVKNYNPKAPIKHLQSDYLSLSDTSEKGRNLGKGLYDKIKNPMGMLNLNMPNLNLSGIKDNTAQTAKNTEKLGKGKLKFENDNLEYLREFITKREITRLTLDKINVIVNAKFGDVHKTADIDELLEHFNNGVEETLNQIGDGLAYE